MFRLREVFGELRRHVGKSLLPLLALLTVYHFALRHLASMGRGQRHMNRIADAQRSSKGNAAVS